MKSRAERFDAARRRFAGFIRTWLERGLLSLLLHVVCVGPAVGTPEALILPDSLQFGLIPVSADASGSKTLSLTIRNTGDRMLKLGPATIRNLGADHGERSYGVATGGGQVDVEPNG